MVMRCRSPESGILAVMSYKLEILCHVAGLTNGSKSVGSMSSRVSFFIQLCA